MGLARALRRQPEERAQQNWWNLAGAPGFISAAAYGMGGSVEQALRNSASWACIGILADAIGRTPMDVVRGEGAARTPVGSLPRLIARPSGVVQTDVWRAQLGWSLVTDGNAFGRITSLGVGGWPTGIELLNPAAVTERKVVDGRSQVKIDNKVEELYPFGEVWHVPGRMVAAGSPFGLSPVSYAAKTIGTSLSAEEYSQQFFTDGGHPSALIYANTVVGPDQARAVKDAWRRATSGNREPAVLGGDLRYEKIQADPGETQFIDLLRFEVEQACRFWGVPPGMVYGSVSGQAVTYTNITDADVTFLKHSLDVYFVRAENALTDLLPRPQIVKANRNAILRADPKSRYEANAIALANRQVTINELRALEDLPGFGPAFDVPGIPPLAAPAPIPVPQPNGNGAGAPVPAA